MNIKVSGMDRVKYFDEIPFGEVFYWNESYFMRMENDDPLGLNAVDLHTGSMLSLNGGIEVISVNAELLINN